MSGLFEKYMFNSNGGATLKSIQFSKDSPVTQFESARIELQKWAPFLQRTGLKPRRFWKGSEAVYIATSEGWYRLGLKKFSKQELNWVHHVLEYLEERSFKNWAVPWQNTIIWEENNSCYLAQPWFVEGERFNSFEPVSVLRIAELMADFYNCGKDYVQSLGIEVARDRWNIEVKWEAELRTLDTLKVDDFPEKIRSDINELRKKLATLLNESLNRWRNSGMNSLFDNQRNIGILGHGSFLLQNVIWIKNDYYLLNWENIAFQPRIFDLVTFILDASNWEAEWILFLIREYSRIQAFWPEEFQGLQALLNYPQGIMEIFGKIQTEELERKSMKEVVRELARKDRCLGKIWRELGNDKRWAGSYYKNNTQYGINKLSMSVAPVETWGGFNELNHSIIKVKDESKLPTDVMERLSFLESNRIIGGRDANVIEGSTLSESEIKANTVNKLAAFEINEPQEEKQSFNDTEDLPEDSILKSSSETDKIIRWATFPASEIVKYQKQ